MNNPFDPAGFKPDAAFAAAAERFFELMKTFGMPSAGRPGDWSGLAAPLAGQFEQWLRSSQAAGPWFSGGTAPAAGFAAGSSSFGPLPLGPAAASAHDAQRTFELVAKLAQLQGQLAAHWSEIAATAARLFVARAGGQGNAVTLEQSLKLYETWVSCAEEAYAATVHKEQFAHLQAELANTSAALLVEQRRHAETLVRAFGLPSRSEVDALYDQLKELRRQIAELERPAARATGAPKAARGTAPRSARGKRAGKRR